MSVFLRLSAQQIGFMAYGRLDIWFRINMVCCGPQAKFELSICFHLLPFPATPKVTFVTFPQVESLEFRPTSPIILVSSASFVHACLATCSFDGFHGAKSPNRVARLRVLQHFRPAQDQQPEAEAGRPGLLVLFLPKKGRISSPQKGQYICYHPPSGLAWWLVLVEAKWKTILKRIQSKKLSLAPILVSLG